jgi:hypothetical protein
MADPLDNLVPYQPGQSGNPAGRPKLTPEEKAVKKALKEMVKEYKEKLADALIDISPVLIAEALKGNITAIKEINDRVMGKPEQQTDITSGGEKINPIPILQIQCHQESTLEPKKPEETLVKPS